jgi:hypothetical protein
MSRRNETPKIILGILLLLAMHFVLFLLVCLTLFIVSAVPTPISSDYKWLLVIFIPAGSIAIFQLIYVIPVSLWLKRKRQLGMMKGVIIGAVITALLNGGCWLFVASQSR